MWSLNNRNDYWGFFCFLYCAALSCFYYLRTYFIYTRKVVYSSHSNNMSHLKESFLPLLPSQPRILILGSIPGDRSIELQEYYGHPQNRLWKLMAALLNENTPTDYNEKKRMLLRHQIALWNVAHRATRPGNMDSAIRDEGPNNIHQLLADYPSIEHIIFNGKKAEQLYGRHFKRLPNINYWGMPSTSPANAANNLDALIATWQKTMNPWTRKSKTNKK